MKLPTTAGMSPTSSESIFSGPPPARRVGRPASPSDRSGEWHERSIVAEVHSSSGESVYGGGRLYHEP